MGISEERHTEISSVTKYLLIVRRPVFGIGERIRDVNYPALQCNTSGHAATARPQRVFERVPYRFRRKTIVRTKSVKDRHRAER